MKRQERRFLRIGDVYRYSSSYDKDAPMIDDLPNFIYVTNTDGKNKVLMEYKMIDEEENMLFKGKVAKEVGSGDAIVIT